MATLLLLVATARADAPQAALADFPGYAGLDVWRKASLGNLILHRLTAFSDVSEEAKNQDAKTLALLSPEQKAKLPQPLPEAARRALSESLKSRSIDWKTNPAALVSDNEGKAQQFLPLAAPKDPAAPPDPADQTDPTKPPGAQASANPNGGPNPDGSSPGASRGSSAGGTPGGGGNSVEGHKADDGSASGGPGGKAASQAGKAFDKKTDDLAAPGAADGGMAALTRMAGGGARGGGPGAPAGGQNALSGAGAGSRSGGTPGSPLLAAGPGFSGGGPAGASARRTYGGAGAGSGSASSIGLGGTAGSAGRGGAPGPLGGGAAGGEAGFSGGLKGPSVPGTPEKKSDAASAKPPADANELTEEEKKELADIQKLLKDAAASGALDGPAVQAELDKLPKDGSLALSGVEERVAQMLGMTGRALTMGERQQVLALASQMSLSADQSDRLPPAVEHGTPPAPESLNRKMPRWERWWSRLTASPGKALLWLLAIAACGIAVIAASRRRTP